MQITREDIEIYLSEVRECVKQNRYKIEKNKNRTDNSNLFLDYVIDEEKVKKILLSLTADNFSEIRANEHPRFSYERLYIFGIDVKLLERFGTGEKIVPLYIKFNKLKNSYVIVVSFHEQRYTMKYYFV